MTGSCPRCQTPVELPAPGAYECPKCHRAFDAYPVRAGGPPIIRRTAGVEAAFTGFATPTGATAPAEGYAPERTTPVGQARCATHANNHAVGACERCGDFMCGLCETPIQGRLYCPRCYDMLFARGAVAVASGQSNNSPSTALVLGILSVVFVACTPINFGLAIAALVIGLGCLKQIRNQPDLPGRGMAVASLILAGISILGGLGFLAFTIFSSSR